MADWSLPSITNAYASVISYINAKFTDASLMLDSALTTPTNLATGAKRWNSGTNNFESWNGSAWSAMTVNATTATSATTATNSSGTGTIPKTSRNGLNLAALKFTTNNTSNPTVYSGDNLSAPFWSLTGVFFITPPAFYSASSIVVASLSVNNFSVSSVYYGGCLQITIANASGIAYNTTGVVVSIMILG